MFHSFPFIALINSVIHISASNLKLTGLSFFLSVFFFVELLQRNHRASKLRCREEGGGFKCFCGTKDLRSVWHDGTNTSSVAAL